MSESNTWLLNKNLTVNNIDIPLLSLILFKLGAVYYIIQRYEIEPAFKLDQLIIAASTILMLNIVLEPTKRKLGILFTTSVISIVMIGLLNSLLLVLTIIGLILSLRINFYRPIIPIIYLISLIIIQTILIKRQSPEFQWLKIAGIILLYKAIYFIYYNSIINKSDDKVNTINYFFMAPHLSISLFPAIDPSKTSIFTGNDVLHLLKINKKGVQWISLGLFQIVLYRLVYHEFTVSTIEITNIFKLTQYIVTNYLLILRLSGLFHITTGILCLMGYDMPKIFHNYFLASSISDVWRRINIYFKDFINTVFFNPIYFKIRTIFKKQALALTTIIVFILSWAIHNYQWFWVKGYFPIKLNDFIFWISLGVLIALQTNFEIHKKVHKQPNNAIRVSFNIVLTFMSMAVLWSLWTAKDLNNWLNLFNITYSYIDIMKIIFLFTAGFTIISFSLYTIKNRNILNILEPSYDTKAASVYSAGYIILLLILNNHYTESITKNNQWISNIIVHNKNKEDNIMLIESYYENILSDNVLNLDYTMSLEKDLDKNQDVKISTNDFRNIKLKADLKTTFKGATFTTNQYGFRNREISKNKQPNTKRFIIMGGSFTVGSGVNDNEVFSSILEDKLNINNSNYKYEFINTAVPSYDLIDYFVHFEKENIQQFNPDYMMIIVHGLDEIKTIRDLARYYGKGQSLPYDKINELMIKQNITKDLEEDEIVKRLLPIGNTVVKVCYEEIYNLCLKNKIKPIWIYWPPLVRKNDSLIDKNKSLDIVETLGYTIIDLEYLYDNYQYKDLILNKFDSHPNAIGHKIFAMELYNKILKLQ